MLSYTYRRSGPFLFGCPNNTQAVNPSWVTINDSDGARGLRVILICTRCSEAKPIQEFVRESRSKSGYRSVCRTCKGKARTPGFYDGTRNNCNREWRSDRTHLKVAEKRCTACGQTKDARLFAVDRRSSSGLFHICRECDQKRRLTRQPRACEMCHQVLEQSCFRWNRTVCVSCEPPEAVRMAEARKRKRVLARQIRKALKEASKRMANVTQCAICGEGCDQLIGSRCYVCYRAYRKETHLKRCSVCQHYKPKEAFGHDSSQVDEKNGVCKACLSRREKQRFMTMERRVKHTIYKRSHKARDPQKHFARQMVAAAVAGGFLLRGPCEVCGTIDNVQGHHDDYPKPLDVRWMCFRHHCEVHGKVVANDRFA